MHPMRVVGVRVELPANQPVVLLREEDGVRYLPIWIGAVEASAIAFQQQGVKPARPLTHDLLKNVLDELTTSLDRIVVTEVRDRTYYAELYLVNAAGTHTVSSRPSDAIALAVRTGTPIFAEESLLDEVGQEQDETEPASEGDQDELIEDFRDFIENVKPEDFGGG